MNAPADPLKVRHAGDVPARELLAMFVVQGRRCEARKLAMQLRELIGHDVADGLWRDFYGRGLFDED